MGEGGFDGRLRTTQRAVRTAIGRAPVVVERVSVATRGGGMSLTPVGDRIGPDMPYNLQAGSNASWYVGLDSAVTLAASSRDVLSENVTGVYMTADLGIGKTIETRQTLRA